MGARRLKRALALEALPDELAGAANGLSLLAGALFRRFFVEFPALHFPEGALALHFLLKRAQSLLDIVVANENLDQGTASFSKQKRRGGLAPESRRSTSDPCAGAVSCGVRRAGL